MVLSIWMGQAPPLTPITVSAHPFDSSGDGERFGDPNWTLFYFNLRRDGFEFPLQANRLMQFTQGATLSWSNAWNVSQGPGTDTGYITGFNFTPSTRIQSPVVSWQIERIPGDDALPIPTMIEPHQIVMDGFLAAPVLDDSGNVVYNGDVALRWSHPAGGSFLNATSINTRNFSTVPHAAYPHTMRGNYISNAPNPVRAQAIWPASMNWSVNPIHSNLVEQGVIGLRVGDRLMINMDWHDTPVSTPHWNRGHLSMVLHHRGTTSEEGTAPTRILPSPGDMSPDAYINTVRDPVSGGTIGTQGILITDEMVGTHLISLSVRTPTAHIPNVMRIADGNTAWGDHTNTDLNFYIPMTREWLTNSGDFTDASARLRRGNHVSGVVGDVSLIQAGHIGVQVYHALLVHVLPNNPEVEIVLVNYEQQVCVNTGENLGEPTYRNSEIFDWDGFVPSGAGRTTSFDTSTIPTSPR